MGTSVKVLGAFAAALVIWQSSVLAEMVQGQVTAVNQENRTVTLQQAQPDGKAKEIDLSIPADAEFRGIQSLGEVEVGDEIRAEANKPALGMGAWQTTWIERSNMPDEKAGAHAQRTAGADAASDAPEKAAY